MVTGLLKSWILGMAGAAVFCAVMTEICPKGPVKSVVKTLCGIVMALALLSPLGKLDTAIYSMNLARYRQEGQVIVEGGKEMAQQHSRTIIEEQCRAYILDKAAELGAAAVDADVELSWSSEGFWYPVRCSINGPENDRLASAIAAELGIGKEHQYWSGNDESA